MENQRGTIKREIGSVQIRGFEIGEIITNALLEKGYELLAKPIIEEMGIVKGEQITIYRIDQR